MWYLYTCTQQLQKGAMLVSSKTQAFYWFEAKPEVHKYNKEMDGIVRLHSGGGKWVSPLKKILLTPLEKVRKSWLFH